MVATSVLFTAGLVVLAGATAATVLSLLLIVRPSGLRQLARNLRTRPRATLAPPALLGSILLLNKLLRDVTPEVSQLLGWNVTGLIFAIEGSFVAQVQSLATPWLTALLSALYLSGYVFLLVFPVLAYASLRDLTPLTRLTVAASLNYLVGLLLYTLFISYGPRNLLPDLVDPLLYATYPQSQLITSQVNTNTNVFPSLHTSLSVTVAIVSWQTRESYPWWPVVAVPVAAGIVLSTMYLGIHWATDVVAGVGLAVGSVRAATWWTETRD